MKVVHFAKYGPHQAGIYETAHDLVLAERKVGIDAQLVDFDGKDHKSGMIDRNVECMPIECAYQADILVRHSAIPTKLQYLKPIVFAIHGRPESSFRLEQKDEVEVITGFYNKSKDARYKAFVTFWEEYLPVWRIILPNIEYVPATVDLELFKREKYYREKPRVLIADIWREDVTPFNMIFATMLAHEKLPDMELKIIGLENRAMKILKPVFEEANRRKILYEIAGTIKEIKDYYEWSNILITPHVIATRVIREACAMDIDIVAGHGCKYTPYNANPMDIYGFANQIVRAWKYPEDYSPRQMAEKHFSLETAGGAMKKVFERILKPHDHKKKVFIDLGGHIGQTVRRFYREVKDASDWDIYSFEPSPKNFKVLQENAGFLPNVKLINALATNHNEFGYFYEGTVNHGDGSTELSNKLTGGLSKEAIKVTAINFGEWLSKLVADYIVVKMNIEGGEYLLMENMPEKVNKFLINTHSHKFPQPERQRFEEIEKRFGDRFNVVFKPKGEIPFDGI